ncbi:hypothetical protein, partial [Bacteroides intestinalis]|uniref:hypothetical protein n=1 Tax=Bacteroides intestinalis TaxID=329854 RepID=UPI001EE0186F
KLCSNALMKHTGMDVYGLIEDLDPKPMLRLNLGVSMRLYLMLLVHRISVTSPFKALGTPSERSG